MTRQELRDKIPQGYCKVIAQRAGVTRKSVSCFLKGRTKNSLKIEMVALQLLVELSKQKSKLIQQIK